MTKESIIYIMLCTGVYTPPLWYGNVTEKS